MANKFFLAACILMLLNACGSQETKPNDAQPDWLMAESAQFPRTKYLTGVGEADTMADAKARARAEIANIFNVTIQSTSSDVSSFEQSSVGIDSQSSNELSVYRDIQSSTEQRLEGVKIAELWKDPAEQRYYALAILPRQLTAMNLHNEVTQLDNATGTLIARIQQSDSLISKIRLSADTLPLQQKRRVLNKQLQVVSLTGQSIAEQWSVEKLQMDHAALIARITITATATGVDDTKLQTKLEDALANQGFTVVPNGNYLIKAHLESTPLPPQGRWYYEKASLSISLSGESKQSLGGYAWDFKVSSSDPTLTKLRVLEQASKYLQGELDSKLFEILEKE